MSESDFPWTIDDCLTQGGHTYAPDFEGATRCAFCGRKRSDKELNEHYADPANRQPVDGAKVVRHSKDK